LKTYGLDYLSIGLFGLIHLPYTLKIFIAPILDQVSLPILKAYLGQRRSWLCVVQVAAIAGLLGMVCLDPIQNLILFVTCGFVVSLSAASQHILLLTYQMETLHSREWGIGEGMSIFGYRMGILTSGAGALYLATYFTWQDVYLIMAALMSLGLIAVLIMREPDRFSLQHTHSFANPGEWFRYSIIGPFQDFMTQNGWMAILVFMLIYRLPENLLSIMQNLFLLDLGFSYIDISNVAKIFGLSASILGGILGGYWIRRYGYKPVLFWSALAHGLSCLLFLIQEQLGANLPFLYLTIGIEHFLSGVTLTGFLSYQFTCCNVTFAATQLALLTSLASLTRTICSPLTGWMVDSYGWSPYLILVVLSSIPGILLVFRVPFSRP
jgi:PAT family beta-lactamase induction signal transducer AmpG